MSKPSDHEHLILKLSCWERVVFGRDMLVILKFPDFIYLLFLWVPVSERAVLEDFKKIYQIYFFPNISCWVSLNDIFHIYRSFFFNNREVANNVS